MDAEAVRALIDRYDAAWNAQDLDAVHAAHAPGVVFHNHTAGEDEVVGADAVRAHIGGIFERWPTLRFARRRLHVRDDLAVSEWTATAQRADGAQISWDGVDVFPIEDGRIARKDVYSASHAPRVLTPPGG